MGPSLPFFGVLALLLLAYTAILEWIKHAFFTRFSL
jgi:hypothetical protein